MNIQTPTLLSDFKAILKLVEDNLAYDQNFNFELLTSLPVGCVLIAEEDDKVVGVLVQRSPGQVFTEIDEEWFSLDQIDLAKEKIGFIEAVVVDPAFQRKKIGQKLLAEALKYQKDFGSQAVLTLAWQSSRDHASEKLFTAAGFSPLEIKKEMMKEYSLSLGKKGYRCSHCGNPCHCDSLEMIKYL